MGQRRLFMLSIGAALAAPLSRSWAQAPYPDKPIRLVVPFPPGGGADIAARAIAGPLSEALGKPVVVDNRAGADGIIAGEAVKSAPADGYTLLFGTATGLSGAPALHKALPYDPLRDFTPISRIGTFVFFLFVSENLPVRSVAELSSHVRANPGKYSYGTGSATGIMAGAQLVQLGKLDMVQVPYKGEAPAVLDLLADRVQLMFCSGGPALPHVRAGKLRPLATLLAHRSPLLPEVPTLAQAGLSLSINPWAGLFGPPGLARPIANQLSRELAKVLNRADVREQLGGLAFEAESSTPEDLAEFVKQQLHEWKAVAVAAGIRPE